MLCIFCLQEKPARAGAGEHPISLAVGGSWTIDRVCEDCDNKFGYTHDARLSEVTKVAERREALKLAGNSGKIPNVLNNALARPVTVADAPHHRMMVRQSGDGTFKTKTIPKIEFEITVQDGQCFAALKPETFVLGMATEEETCSLIRRRLKAALKDKDISFDDDVIVGTADKVFAQIEVFEKPITVKVTREIVTGGYAPALFKAAYEAAWYWLGDAWLSDPEAERIRRHLNGDESVSVKGAMQEGEIRRLNVQPTDRQHAHAIYLFGRNGSLAVEVQLFDLYSAGVVVTTAPEKYKLPANSAIVMDAVAATYRELPSKDLFKSS